MNDREFYRTAPRPKGARSGGVDSRPGEDPDRGGQKSFTRDPDGMKETEPKVSSNEIDPKKRKQEGADSRQPVRGNEPGKGKTAGDAAARGEKRTTEKTRF
jgi:hypothetical protein